MYAYLNGVIADIKPSYLVLENNGVGYLIIVANPYSYKQGENVKIFLHHYVRDDIFNLYGFHTNEAKDLFIKLISVSGVGPKTALSIMAADNLDLVVSAIENSDFKYLTKFPGIGNKTAQQIILDLKGKLVLDLEDSLISSTLKDTEDALIALGYSKRDITRVLKKVDETLSTSDALKEALKLIVGN